MAWWNAGVPVVPVLYLFGCLAIHKEVGQSFFGRLGNGSLRCVGGNAAYSHELGFDSFPAAHGGGIGRRRRLFPRELERGAEAWDAARPSGIAAWSVCCSVPVVLGWLLSCGRVGKTLSLSHSVSLYRCIFMVRCFCNPSMHAKTISGSHQLGDQLVWRRVSRQSCGNKVLTVHGQLQRQLQDSVNSTVTIAKRCQDCRIFQTSSGRSRCHLCQVLRPEPRRVADFRTEMKIASIFVVQNF